MGMLYVIGLLFALIGMLVQSQLKKKIQKYSEITLLNHLSGREIAERMLKENGIYDVKVISVNGELTDHYNPTIKTVNLSQDVYHGRNAASAAIAAHECGHAVQHQLSYPFLGLRSSLVPIVNVAGTVMPWVLMAGVFLINQIPGLILLAIIAQAMITLFTLITLPVEFDASRRALLWMQQNGIVVTQEYDAAKDALRWAAMTYVVVALAAVAQLVYLLSRYSSRRN